MKGKIILVVGAVCLTAIGVIVAQYYISRGGHRRTAIVMLHLAVQEYDKQNYLYAIKYSSQAIALEPDYYAPYCMIGSAFQELGKFKMAKREFDICLALLQQKKAELVPLSEKQYEHEIENVRTRITKIQSLQKEGSAKP